MLANPDVLMEGHAAVVTHNLNPCLHLKYLLCTHIKTVTTVPSLQTVGSLHISPSQY